MKTPLSWQYFSPASNRVKVVSATDGQSGEKKRPLPFPETVRTPRARPFQKNSARSFRTEFGVRRQRETGYFLEEKITSLMIASGWGAL